MKHLTKYYDEKGSVKALSFLFQKIRYIIYCTRFCKKNKEKCQKNTRNPRRKKLTLNRQLS